MFLNFVFELFVADLQKHAWFSHSDAAFCSVGRRSVCWLRSRRGFSFLHGVGVTGSSSSVGPRVCDPRGEGARRPSSRVCPAGCLLGRESKSRVCGWDEDPHQRCRGLGGRPRGGAVSAGTPGGDPVRTRALWLRVPPLRVRAWHELSTVTASEQQEKHFAQRLQAHQRVPLRVRRPHRPAARGCWPSPRACSCQPDTSLPRADKAGGPGGTCSCTSRP